MNDEKLETPEKKVLPRWLVIIVIMATAGITAAALSATGLRGPVIAWDRANKGIAGVWTGEQGGLPGMPAAQPTGVMPAAAPAALQPAAAATPTATPAQVQPVVAQPVALTGAPVIVWGTPIGHGDRGACTNCHTVVFPQGMPLPIISALSAMPHEFRGVCNNCHQIRINRLGGITQVAGTINAPNAPVAAAAPATPRQPTEAEWRGLEVAISTQGVMVNGADGVAKRAGVRVGDVITSINAVPITTMADFVRATENGALTQGTVIARRDGQRLAFEIGPRVPEGQRNLPEPQRNLPENLRPENQRPENLRPENQRPENLRPENQRLPMQPMQTQMTPMQTQMMPMQAMPPPMSQVQPQQAPMMASPMGAPMPAPTAWGAPAAPRGPEAQF
jgi:hypothetical protein